MAALRKLVSAEPPVFLADLDAGLSAAVTGVSSRSRSGVRLTQAHWLIAAAGGASVVALTAVILSAIQWNDMHAGLATAERQARAAQAMAVAAQTQANAARDAVALARAQADLSRQLLTLQQAAASAQQATAASAAAVAAPMDLAAQELEVSGLRGLADRHGRLPLTLRYRFANLGKDILSLKAVSITPYVGKDLPSQPAYAPAKPTQIQIPPGAALMNSSGVGFPGDATLVKAVNAGQAAVFVYGYVDYRDAADAAHRSCFAYRLDTQGKDASQTFNAAGGDAYRCAAAPPAATAGAPGAKPSK